MSGGDTPPLMPGVFGTFDRLSVAQQESIIAYLRAAWRAQVGRDLGSLEVDFAALEELYSPALQAKKLRSIAERLVPIPGRRPHVDQRLFVAVDAARGFVTAEGRALLEWVRHKDGEPELASTLLGRLVDFYAAPRREWMAQTFVGGDLRPATLGFVVFLLINNSTEPIRGLVVPAASDEEQRLAEAVMPVAGAFATGIGGQPLARRESERISGNWAVTESRRQMHGVVRHEGGKRVERIYIDAGKETDAVVAVATALRRRRGLGQVDVEMAFDAAAREYADKRPLLKSWGLSWETERHTVAVRAQLAEALRQAKPQDDL